MDWSDATRSAILVGHLTVVGFAVLTIRCAKLSLRKVSAALVGGVSLSWAAFYVWVIPTFWNTHTSPETARDLAPIMSRIAGAMTVVALLLILWIIRRAENVRDSAVANAAERLRVAFGNE